MSKNLVLLSYGGEIEYKRAIFCIQSFLSWDIQLANIRIVVYTDLPSYFTQYIQYDLIEYILLTPELSQELMRNTAYIHLKKVGVIQLTFQKYPDDDLCFIDTDTFFINNPSYIFEAFEIGKCFLHKKEYQLSDSIEKFASFGQGEFPKSFMKFISDREFNIGGKSESFDGTYFSWNTGVIAVNKDFSKLMENVVDLTLQFHNNSKWFISEQLAFSLILQKIAEIRPAEQIVFHYWGKRQKVFMDNYLSVLLNQKSEYNAFFKNFRKSIEKLRIEIENDLSLEQINIAVTQKSYFYAFKQGIKIILKNPLNLQIYRKIYYELV